MSSQKDQNSEDELSQVPNTPLVNRTNGTTEVTNRKKKSLKELVQESDSEEDEQDSGEDNVNSDETVDSVAEAKKRYAIPKRPVSPKEINIEVNSREDVKAAWPNTKNKRILFKSLEFTNLSVAVKYVITDTKRHKRDWLIGLITVFLVVTVTSLLQNAVSKSPIIFLKLAEDSVGEYDLLMTPEFTASSQNFFLNSTEIDLSLRNAPSVVGVAARWVLLSRIVNAQDQTQDTSTAILIIDSDREREIELGRGWKHPTLRRDEAHVSRSVLKNIGVNANSGESVILRLDIAQFLQSSGLLTNDAIEFFIAEQLGQSFDPALANATLAQLINNLTPNIGGINVTAIISALLGNNSNINLDVSLVEFIQEIATNLVIQREFLVVDQIESPNGKYPAALGNVAIIESKYVNDIVRETVNGLRTASGLNNLNIIRIAILPFLPPDQQEALEQFLDFLQQVDDVLVNFESNFNVNHYALLVIAMYKDRFEAYVKGTSGLDRDMIDFTNEVSDTLGFTYPATFTLPIATALTPLYFIRLFLDQILTFVVVVLIILGILLVYSLLLSNVEEKTYEYGMLRAQGMKSYVLIELLVVQSLSFSIPGVALGLLASFLFFIPIAQIISDFAISPLDITMDGLAATLGVILGLVMPLIAIIGPIQRALSRTLRDALDIYHQVQSEVTVRIIKLEKLGLSPWQISASVTMIVMGFVVYYVIPYAFTFGNFALFFLILTLILLGMLLGLSLVGIILQPYLEKLAVYCLLWGEDRRTLSHLVRKNLSAHSRRNIKTAIMFTTSLAFIIFAGASFSLQAYTISSTVSLATGFDIVVFAPLFGATAYLDEAPMREYLNAQMSRPDPLVLGYSFMTPALNNIDWIRRTSLSNLAGFPNLRISLYGVEENYVKESYQQFYNPTEVSPQFTYEETRKGKPDAIKSLFTHAGQAQLPIERDGIIIPPSIISQNTDGNSTESTATISTEEAYTNYIDIVVSESLRLTASIDVNTPLKMSVNFNLDSDNRTTFVYLCKPRAMVSQFPGLFFSSYRQTAFNSPALVSMPTFYRLMNQTWSARTDTDDETFPSVPPQRKLGIRIKPGLSKEDREIIINGLRNFVDDDSIEVVDTADLIGSTKIALDMLTLFFNVVSIIAVTLCFFVLWLSFTANVNENAWEFGVLRALGIDSFRVVRMYIYEALCLISASVIIGAAIGLLVAITLTLQFLLFSEMAFVFNFPYALFFSVFGMSIVVAALGSYIPSRVVIKKPIAIALKNM